MTKAKQSRLNDSDSDKQLDAIRWEKMHARPVNVSEADQITASQYKRLTGIDLKPVSISDKPINKYGLYYIGIDPGVNTGYAIWDKRAKVLREVATFKIHEIMRAIEADWKVNKDAIQIVIEESRHGWNPKAKDAALKQQGAGSIKRDCKIWEDFLTDLGVPFRFATLKKTKMNQQDFKKLTGWQKQTNSHGRDAALLVFGL